MIRMKTAGSALYRQVHLNHGYLSEKMLDRYREKNGSVWSDLSLEQRGYIRDEFGATVGILEESLATGSPALLLDHARWERTRFASRNFPADRILSFFKTFQAVVASEVPDDYRDDAISFAKRAVAFLKSPPAETGAATDSAPALSPKARSFLKAALAGDQGKCRELVDSALAAGMPVQELYKDIFRPVLRETGHLWEQNLVTIAQEHYTTAVIRQIMVGLHDRIAAAGNGVRKKKTVVAACVGEELHEIGIRMVADLFTLDGWYVYYTGANTPAKSILAAVVEQKADVLALSVTMPSRLPDVRYLIRALRSDKETKRVKVIAGGYPFGIVPDLGNLLGIDAVAADAEDAVARANRLMEKT